MTARAVIGAAVLLTLCAASAWSYARDHRGAAYARGRARLRGSVPLFRYAYSWIRCTTPLAGLGALFGTSAWWLAWPVPGALFWSATVLALAGFGLFVAARRALGAAYAPCYDARRPGRIVTSGVYRRVRHPIYTANVAAMSGLTLMTGSGWLLANTVVLAAFCLVAAHREEADLRAEDPTYAAHCARSGRFLPRLRPRCGRPRASSVAR